MVVSPGGGTPHAEEDRVDDLLPIDHQRERSPELRLVERDALEVQVQPNH